MLTQHMLIIGRRSSLHSVAEVELHLCGHPKGVCDMRVHAGGIRSGQLAAVRLISAHRVQVAPLAQRPEHGLSGRVGQGHAHELARALDADVRSRFHAMRCLRIGQVSRLKPSEDACRTTSTVLRMHQDLIV